jgi:putative sterol carrier protein
MSVDEKTIEDVAAEFRTRAGEFTPLKARVMFDLGDEGALLVDATESPPEISTEPGEADCTIRLSLANLAKLMAGNLSPTLAYAMGKLKIEGSMGLAMKVAALLDDD